jgi:elongator complex protein 3
LADGADIALLETQYDPDRHARACHEIAQRLLHDRGGVSPEELKLIVARSYQLSSVPRNSEILAVVSAEERVKLRQMLQLKRVRSISGVHVIGVMSSPHQCPHGRCAYCPQENDAPTSYTGYEPAAMRAKQNNFDPYAQLSSRLVQLGAIGHRTSKVEIVVQGGTFLARPQAYQQYFMKRCLDALNESESISLDEAKSKAWSSTIRNVGITFETRPDWARAEHVDLMLSYGATRVEIGVQTLDENVLRLVERGHSVADVIKSFQIAKDAGLKIVAHMMPGLPGSTSQQDLNGFKRLVSDPDFRPDMLKIYPCLVVHGTKAHDWWQNGTYSPLDVEAAVQLIADIKEFIPPWMRIMRVQREIPARLILAGPDKGNLRERALTALKKDGRRCRCIRCREAGHRRAKEKVEPEPEDIMLIRRYYESSDGTEIFLSKEDPKTDTLIAYLRLRIPSPSAHRSEINSEKSSIVRELHVYGPAVPVGERDAAAWQHKGYGISLLKEAEQISMDEYDVKKILVLSALGTREYYSRVGYTQDGPYMGKRCSGSGDSHRF